MCAACVCVTLCTMASKLNAISDAPLSGACVMLVTDLLKCCGICHAGIHTQPNNPRLPSTTQDQKTVHSLRHLKFCKCQPQQRQAAAQLAWVQDCTAARLHGCTAAWAAWLQGCKAARLDGCSLPLIFFWVQASPCMVLAFPP